MAKKIIPCPYCYDGLTARSSERDPDLDLWEYECEICDGVGLVSEAEIEKEEEYINFFNQAVKELKGETA